MINRRSLLLKGAIALAAAALVPLRAFAAWPKDAFSSDSASDAMNALLGGSEPSASDAITLTAPDIAENGAVVQVSVETTLAGAQSISLYAMKNPSPLVAAFTIVDGMQPKITTRIKMRSTSDLVAVVQSADGLFSTQKEIKVTIGGCGG